MARAVIVGAGLAGLACAIRLTKAGIPVTLLEAARHAGGRCRSLHEKSLGTTIDNGNHLLLSGNLSAMAYLDDIGARDRLVGPEEARFPFADLKTGERWTVAPNEGRLPVWIFDANRRVAGTTPLDYLSIVRMLRRHRDAVLTDVVPPQGALYERFWDPFTVAVLNSHPQVAAAELLTPVFWETFAKGAAACRPLVARDGLSDTFIDPALRFVRDHGGEIRFGGRVAEIAFETDRAALLRCGEASLKLDDADVIVLAVPAPVAAGLVPGLTVPGRHSTIVNVHYRLEREPQLQDHFIGLVGGLAQWLFVRGDIASVTISAGDAVAERSSDDIAKEVWSDIAPILNLDTSPLPRCRVIKERRATFLQTPDQVALRPPTRTRYTNLLLAGDWTDTGLPATIEGAIRSGHSAADAARRQFGSRQ